MFKRLCLLRDEAKRIRQEYNPRTAYELGRAAEKEYGITVIRSPLFFGRSVVFSREGLDAHIFYEGTTENGRLHELGHEIGHIIAGHQSMAQHVPEWLQEWEADHFARMVNGFGILQRQLICHREFHSALVRMFTKPHFDIDAEKKRLEGLLTPNMYATIDRYVDTRYV